MLFSKDITLLYHAAVNKTDQRTFEWKNMFTYDLIFLWFVIPIMVSPSSSDLDGH